MKKKLFPIATASALILTMSVPSFACTKCENRKNDNGNHLGWHKSEIYEVVDGQFDNNGKHLGQFKEEWGSWVEPVEPENPDVPGEEIPEEDVEWFFYSIIDDVKGGSVSMTRDYASKGFFQIKYEPVAPDGMIFTGFMGNNGKVYQTGDSVDINEIPTDAYGERCLTLTVMYEALPNEEGEEEEESQITNEAVYDFELFWHRNKENAEIALEYTAYSTSGLTRDQLDTLSINLKDRTTAARFARIPTMFTADTNGVFGVEGYKILSSGKVFNTTDVITAEDFNFAPVYNPEADEIIERDGEKVRIQHYTVREEIAPAFTLDGVLTTLDEARFNLEVYYHIEDDGDLADDMNTDGTTAQLGNLITFGIPEGIAKEGYTFLGYAYDFDATTPDFVYDYEEQKIVTPYLLTSADICQHKTLFIALYPVYVKNAE